MEENGEQRESAAIVARDFTGHNCLTGVDEVGTVERVKQRWSVNRLRRHNLLAPWRAGSVGDGVLIVAPGAAGKMALLGCGPTPQ